MKVTFYICTAMFSVALLVNGLASRYQIEILSMPSISEKGVDEVIVRLDKLTG